MPAPLTLVQYRLAFSTMKRVVGMVDQVRLGDITRRVENSEPELSDRITPRAIAGMLRRHGFQKTGTTGSGYDREPVYSRKVD